MNIELELVCYEGPLKETSRLEPTYLHNWDWFHAKIFKNGRKKKFLNLLTEDVVCFALVITEAVISLEADLPLNSGNWEDEDLVERPLKFAAAHNPPLPEVVELREPLKKGNIT